jgi:murein DD-endopeptidase MepM/ murein hydrolase activator NlpD
MNEMKSIRPVLASIIPLLLAACSSTPQTPETRTVEIAAPPEGTEPLQPGMTEAPNRIPDEAMPPAEGSFLWPVRGAVVERRGAAGLGIRAAGDIVAVKSGLVRLLLSSWHSRRNLIIIRHADGYLSEYSDVDEILVPAGKAVRQGDPIARLKAPGGVLHFRLYREKQALDPGLFLP